MAPQGHALLPVNEQAVVLHFNVLLEAFLVAAQVLQRVVGLLQLVLQVFDALVQLCHLLHQLVVGPVVAVFYVGAPEALLQAGLCHPQRRIFGGDLTFQALNVPFQFGNFLKGGLGVFYVYKGNM